MAVETSLRSLSICLGLLFLVATAHKLRVVWVGSASAQPLVARRGLTGPGASAAVLGAAAVELVVVAALLVNPGLGCLMAAVLLAAYALELRRLAPDERCMCFGEMFDSATRKTAIWRNWCLAIAAVGVAAWDLGGMSVAPLSDVTVGIALIVAAVAAALAALDSQVRPRDRVAAN